MVYIDVLGLGYWRSEAGKFLHAFFIVATEHILFLFLDVPVQFVLITCIQVVILAPNRSLVVQVVILLHRLFPALLESSQEVVSIIGLLFL